MSTEHTVPSRVIAVIAEILGSEEEQINDEMSLEALQADSLDVVEICIALENEFNIDIWDEEILALETVQQVIDLVSDKVSDE